MLKLPKGVLAHPKIAAIEALFSANLSLLRPEGKLKVPHWKFDAGLGKALTAVAAMSHLIPGLEAASKSLGRERQGLELLVTKAGQTQNPRLSRLLLLSNDGSERFYHDAESLLLQYTGRLLGCVLDATSEDLGALLLPPQKIAKALMIEDRKVLEHFLVALVG